MTKLPESLAMWKSVPKFRPQGLPSGTPSRIKHGVAAVAGQGDLGVPPGSECGERPAVRVKQKYFVGRQCKPTVQPVDDMAVYETEAYLPNRLASSH